MVSSEVLQLFSPKTREWFQKSMGIPTAIQESAWPAIASGQHTLVCAPTGTGKTLASFLFFIDQLLQMAEEGTLEESLYLIYISPLKSLAGDIRENLNRPLEGILGACNDTIRVAIRTGDTTPAERRRMIKHPPHILITTPESLYLLLTSKTGKPMLSTAQAIIIDELHALIDTKRGAHLLLSVARLDALKQKPLQRIGLSATIEPLDIAARYLAPETVHIAAPPMRKQVDVAVVSPLSKRPVRMKDPIWRQLARTVYEGCSGKRSVIAFTEGRMYAERLAYYVNELGGEGFARTHHGSLSKEQRLEVEAALRTGRLRLLCATSSMELGIDVGEVDTVFQIGCPRTVSSTMQRLGRAGHNPNRTSVMQIFPKTASEGIYSGMMAKLAREGGIEHSKPPRLCLDILAQHLVSMAAGDGYNVEEVLQVTARAWPFREITKEDIESVLRMLAGDYEHQQDLPVRPRILYDRIHGRVEGDNYSRMLAVSAGGTIPDRGLYTVRTTEGVKLGELDEEYIYEARDGDKFLLGTMAWRIQRHDKNTVFVTPTTMEGARPPFWRGEGKGRSLKTGLAFGQMLRKLSEAAESTEETALKKELLQLGLDEEAAGSAAAQIRSQMVYTGVLPDDQSIIVEHFQDENGTQNMMVHSVYGRQVNAPLCLLVQQAAAERLKMHVSCVDDENGFLLYPYGHEPIPEGILYDIHPEKARAVLEALLPQTPLFNIAFRYNANRALMMGIRKAGRQPLWVQRLRSAQILDHIVQYPDHPLIRETRRECLEDHWDLDGVERILYGIQSGMITVREVYTESPSPMSMPLEWKVEGDQMYNYNPMPASVYKAVEEGLSQAEMIQPETSQLEAVSERRSLPEDAMQLHSLLMTEGDLIYGDLEIPIEWLEQLVHSDRAIYREPGLWIAAEHQDEYEKACSGDAEAMKHVLRRVLRYRGAHTLEQLSERYCWPISMVRRLLSELQQEKQVALQDGYYYHGDLYDRARRATIRLRRQVVTVPSSHYAALLVHPVRRSSPAAEQLKKVLEQFEGQNYPGDFWENVLLPGHVKHYRPAMLDALLAQGEWFWRMTEQGVQFNRYENLDWDTDMVNSGLQDAEAVVYNTLKKRGASFIQSLSVLLNGASALEPLLCLAARGLVTADSFVPVRQLQNQDKLEKAGAKQRARSRALTGTAGRWDIVRPLKKTTLDQKLDRLFDRFRILCKETCTEIPWMEALERLRVMEYTGAVRRGYYVEGMSGAQFIREKDYTGVMQALEKPDPEMHWFMAADPCQPWGKMLPHAENRAFANHAGTAVCLYAGHPVMVLERQGRILRFLDKDPRIQEQALLQLQEDYKEKRIFSAQKRITIKEYPQEAAQRLSQTGFHREMLDYILY